MDAPTPTQTAAASSAGESARLLSEPDRAAARLADDSDSRFSPSEKRAFRSENTLLELMPHPSSGSESSAEHRLSTTMPSHA